MNAYSTRHAAAQWSMHSCLQFNKLVNTANVPFRRPFSWFDCELQAHEQLRYMICCHSER
jgi:hypothetical protein